MLEIWVCQRAVAHPSPRVHLKLRMQFLHLEIKPIRKVCCFLFWLLLLLFDFSKDIKTVCLYVSKRRYMCLHPSCAMVHIPHSHGCQQQPCPSFPSVTGAVFCGLQHSYFPWGYNRNGAVTCDRLI